MVGLQGAGKTTYAARLSAREGHRVVSKDLFRNARRREQRQEATIRAALRIGHSVIVDNGNPTVAVRAPLIRLARDFGARAVAVFFDTPIEVCLARNGLRPPRDKVPEGIIWERSDQLQPPEVEEGFDCVTTVRSDAEERSCGPGWSGGRSP